MARERSGDIKHSLADITQAQKHLGYKVLVNFEDGLRRTVEWYKSFRSQPSAVSEKRARAESLRGCGMSGRIMTPDAAHPPRDGISASRTFPKQ